MKHYLLRWHGMSLLRNLNIYLIDIPALQARELAMAELIVLRKGNYFQSCFSFNPKKIEKKTLIISFTLISFNPFLAKVCISSGMGQEK